MKPRIIPGLVVMTASLLLSACFTGTGKKDELRDPVSTTGISLGIQVNLAAGATQADAAASIYQNGNRQPLVGGDFFVATSSANSAGVVLKSVENLSGDYVGRFAVAGAGDPIAVQTVYDPERAREDRWYPVEDLLIDSGPNQDLIGYVGEVSLPLPLEMTSTLTPLYSRRSDNLVLTWTPGDGEQMTANAIVVCHSTAGHQYSFPRFNVLGNVDAAGSYTLQVGDIIPNVNVVNAFGTLAEELSLLISSAILEYYTYGLVSVKNIPLASFQLQYCDVNLTLFREKGFNLPANVSGGYAIGSTSATQSFRFQP